ncbi:MAG: hypothetical protein IJ319_00865 [Bacteroidaceae bacterium]|nr:hypothetical protein [Bacteroidaceae bacterium]
MLSTKSQSALKEAIVEMTKRFTTADTTTVTDFHFHVNGETGMLTIYDDDDTELLLLHIDEWDNADNKQPDDVIEADIRAVLTDLQKEGVLDNMNVLKPYSCLLVDDEMETIVDLLYVDDDTYIINNDLLKGFDEEMEDFLNHLLSE